MPKRSRSDFPKCPQFVESDIQSLSTAQITDVRNAIGAVNSLFDDLASPPAVSGVSLDSDDVGQFVVVRFTGSTSVTIEFNDVVSITNTYFAKIENVHSPALTPSISAGRYTYVLTLRLKK